MNIISKLSILALVFAATSCCSKPEHSFKATQGEYTDLGGIRIVSLYGTWEEMGQQYGKLAGKHLHHIHDVFLDSIIAKDPAKAEAMNAVAENLFSRYPHRFREFIRGASQTSGLTIEQLKLTNAVEYAEGCFCSGIAVWGDYSDSTLIYGRNYDAASYAPIGEDILITVFHPADGALATASIGYAGEIYAVNGFNEKGIFLELNNGMPTAGSEILFDRLASTTSLMEVLFDANDIDYLDAFFKTHRSFASFTVGVADQNEARAYEWCATGTKRADGTTPKGLMVITNHYVNPEWEYSRPTDNDSWQSLTRRANLLNLAESYKGQIDAPTMCKIISTPIEDGGAMHNLTRYQFVFEPATMKLHIRIEASEEWTEVDMSSYLTLQ